MSRCSYDIVGSTIVVYRIQHLQSSIGPFAITFVPTKKRRLGGLAHSSGDPVMQPRCGEGSDGRPATLAEVSGVFGCSAPMGTELYVHKIQFLAWLEELLTRNQCYDWGYELCRQLPGFAYFEKELMDIDPKKLTRDLITPIADQALTMPKPRMVCSIDGKPWLFVE